MIKRTLQLLTAVIACCSGSLLEARVIEIEITSREAVAGGVPFGTAGPYERITAVARGEVDPADPRNAGIVNLDKAPRNVRGKVEYTTDLFILRPADPANGNGALLYEVNNRGMKLAPGMLMGAMPNPRNPLAGFNDPRTAEDLGDALLLKLGYTLVWSGWDPNASRANGGLAMEAPIAMQDGQPIERIIRDELVIGQPMMIGPHFRTSYPVATLDNAHATLTMRWRVDEQGTPIPRDRWRFKDERTVELLPAGTKPQNGALYELRYRARAPQVTGLGFAATRDVVAYLHHAAETPTPRIQRTLAIGFSQSARFLRGFVAEGFNQDENGERVFDGMLMHIGGAGKVFLNSEFSQPFRTNTQYSDHFFPDFVFPYSTGRTADPTSGKQAGILRGDDSDPLLMEVNTSTEYWQKAASLISTDPQGKKDLALPRNVRAYFLAGLPHAPLAFAQAQVVHPVNLLTPIYVIRSLLLRLDAWVAKDQAPPPSMLPRIDRGTLVPREALGFPRIPGVTPPAAPNTASRIADWVEARTAAGPQPRVLVPQVDADGVDLGGIRIPEVAVPLGTALGWNLYEDEARQGQLASLVGSFIPFAKTKAERLANRDPRPSLDERYANKDDYVTRFRAAIDALVAQGFVRAEDAARYAQIAATTKVFD